MCVGEIIESVSFVMIALKLLVHSLLSNPMLNVLSMLLLHRCLLFDLNFVKLVYLITNSNVFQSFVLKIINPLLSYSLSLSFSLLHVLFHELSSVLIWTFVFEKCTFTTIHLLLQECLKGYIWKELILFELIHNFLLHLTCVHGATSCPTLKSIIRISD